MSLSINAAASCQQVQIQNNNPAPARERAWYEFESISEGFCVVGSVVQLVGGAAALCTGNPVPAIAMFVFSGLHLQGAENSRRVNRMLEIEASSIRLQGSVRTLQGTVHTLQNENANLAAQVTRVTQAAGQLEQRNTDLTARNAELATEVNRVNQAAAQFEQRSAELNAFIQNGDQTLRARYQEFYQLGAQMAITQRELQTSTEALAGVKRDLEESTARLKKQTQETEQFLASIRTDFLRPGNSPTLSLPSPKQASGPEIRLV